jgi:hypothetical protein
MKISSMFKFFVVASFLAIGSAAIAGGGCCPSGGKDKEKEAATEGSQDS